MELVRPPFPPRRDDSAPGRARPRPPARPGDACATFGELLQGREPGGDNDFLVTLPISIKSTATFWSFRDSPNLYVFPREKSKSRLAARLFLERFGLPPGGILRVDSGVAEGKGLASSSADLVATLRAMAHAFDLALETDELLDIMRQIEPTDGVMFDEAVAFFHRRVELRHVIGRLPPLCILAIDEGGVIDTIAYNRRVFEFTDDEMQEYSGLLEGMTRAIRDRDVARIGEYATASTRLHQKRNRKTHLDKLERLMAEHGAQGIVNCHSGTYIGLCFDMSTADALEKIQRCRQDMEALFACPIHPFFSK